MKSIQRGFLFSIVVSIGAAAGLLLGRHGAVTGGLAPAVPATRSGQIGWNAPHHCSGASATIASNASAIDRVYAANRSRRGPSEGAGTRTIRAR